MTFVFSLIGGLLVAIALQLVFANLGIALGLTVLDWSPGKAGERLQAPDEDAVEESDSDTKQSLPITHFLGLGVAIGFSVAVFTAALLSVEFSQIFEPRRGIIFGLIAWATYWLLFIWLSSTTISGIADSLLGSALQGGKQLLSTVKKTAQQTAQLLEGSDQPAESDISTGEYAILQDLMVEVSQLADAQKQLPALLADQRETLLAELAEEGADTVKATENGSTQNGSTSQEDRELKVETTVSSSSARPSVATAVSTSSSSLLSQLDLPSWQQILRRTLNQVDLSEWDVETILQQLPTDNKAVNYAKSQLISSATAFLPDSSTSEDALNAVKNGSSPPERISLEARRAAMKAIQTKLVAYCRYTNTDLLTPENLIEKVQAQREEYRLADDASRSGVSLDIDEIDYVLRRRQKLTPHDRQLLLEALRQAWPVSPVEGSVTEDSNTSEVFQIEEDSSSSEASTEFATEVDDEPELSVSGVASKAYETLENHFQSINWSEVSLEDVKPDVALLLEQVEKQGTLPAPDWQTISSRIQLPESAKAEFTTWLKTAWTDRVQSLQPAVAQSSQDLSHQLAKQITHFLHHQQKAALTPAQMSESLTHVVSGALAILPNPSALSNFSNLSNLWDKETWQETLEKRKDLTRDEIEQVLDWGETVWQPKAQQLGSWLQTIQAEAKEYIDLPDVDTLTQPVADAAQQVIEQLVETKESLVQQAGEVKESFVEQVDEVKADIQRQADAARGQVAIAAWWLFIALVSSGSAAAGAGYLAATY